MMLKGKKRRKGVSIAETVVAMAIIAIVSVTAISVVRHSINISNEERCRREAQNCILDALECFKYAENRNEFQTALSFHSYDYTIDYEYPMENGIEVRYQFDRYSYIVNITVAYYDDDSRDRFQAFVYDRNKSEITFQTLYQRG